MMRRQSLKQHHWIGESAFLAGVRQRIPLVVLALLTMPLSAAVFPSFLSASIFVIEIGKIDPEHSWVVDGQVTRVLRDQDHLNLSPGAFHVSLATANNVVCGGDCPFHWEETEFHPGDRFVVFSDERQPIGDMIAGPRFTQRLQRGVEGLSDLESILAAEDLPWQEQPLTISKTLPNSPGPHDWLMAVYLADLLAGDGPELDTWALEKVVENATFSDEGKASLLGTLARNLHLLIDDPRKGYLQSALFALAPGFFLEDTGKVRHQGLTEIQLNLLFGCDLLSLDGVWGGLPARLAEPARLQMRAKLLAIARNPRVSREGRERALSFVELLRSPH